MTTPTQRSAPPAAGPNPPGRQMTSFWVVVDGLALPSFTECQGLAAEYAVESWPEGGQNGFVHQLPGRVSYSPVRLSRYVDSSSAALAAWFSSVADPARPYRTARISALDAVGTPLAFWNLSGVFASKYTGPTFSSDGSSAATESVELVHHGFVFTVTARARA